MHALIQQASCILNTLYAFYYEVFLLPNTPEIQEG